MTHWSRRSTFVNHLAVAQKAAGEAFCKCRHAWKQFGSSAEFFGELWHQRQHLTPVFPSSAAGVAGMWDRTLKNLRKWIRRYNLRCVLRPRNKTMLSWRYTVVLRHFLADASAAMVCLGSFTTFYKAGKSFENLPILFLLLEKQVAWIKSLQVMLRHLLCLNTWP